MTRKSWSDLTSRQRMSAAIGITVQVLLLAAAQWDISRRPADRINGPKRLWRAVTLINFLGPIAYFVFGIKRRSE